MKHKATVRQPKVFAVIIGVFTSIIITLLSIVGMTSLILNGSLNESYIDFVTFIARSISVFVGCFVTGWIFKEKMIPTFGVVAGCYMIILVAVGIIIFDSAYKDLLSVLLSVALGSVFAVLLKVLPKKRVTYRHRNI